MMFVEARILTYSSDISLRKLSNQTVISQGHIIHIQNIDCKCFILTLTKIIFSILDQGFLENKE